MHLKNVLTRLTLDKLTRSLNERPDRPQTGVWMLLQQGQDQSNKEVAFGQPNYAEGQTSRHATLHFVVSGGVWETVRGGNRNYELH